jgi:excisionase family DNA binding protein
LSAADLIRAIERLDSVSDLAAVGMAVAARTAALASAPKAAENGHAPTLVIADELAEALSLKKSWLMSMARQGKIPCIRRGKYVRFNVAEVAAALRGQSE